MSRARYALLPSRAVADPQLSDTEFRLLAAIGTFLDQDFQCWPSQETLAEMTGKSRSTIIRTLKLLEAKNYIISRKKYPNRPGTHKCYAVLMDGPEMVSDTSESVTDETSGCRTQDATSECRTQDATSHKNDPVERPNGSLSSDQKSGMTQSQLRDALWKAAPDKSRKRSSLKQLYAACETAMKKLPAEKILAGWLAYLDSPDARRDGGEYVPAVDRWIRQEKFDGWIKADPDPQADLLAGDSGGMDHRLDWCFRQYAAEKCWPGAWQGGRYGWGWRPDEPEAAGLYPDALYARHGVPRPDQAKGRAA